MSKNYRSPKTLAYLPIAFLALIAIVYLIFLVCGFGEIASPSNIDIGGRSGSVWFFIIALVAPAEMILWWITGIFFFVWLYRVFKNLPSLKVKRPTYTPIWAIVFWFVPFANIYKPHQIMQQAWRDSDPNCDPELNYIPSSDESDPLITAWWIIFIISVIVFRIVTKLPATISPSQAALAIAIAGLFTTVAAFLNISVIWEITDRQEKRVESLRSASDYAPPQPPVFGAE